MIGNAIAAIIGFLANWLAKFLSTKTVGAIVLAFYYSVALSFWAYFMSVIVILYNQVSNLIRTAGSAPGNGDILCKFYGLLDCLGFIEAFNASKPALFSAFATMFTMIAYREFYRIRKEIIDAVFKYI